LFTIGGKSLSLKKQFSPDSWLALFENKLLSNSMSSEGLFRLISLKFSGNQSDERFEIAERASIKSPSLII
jgi:hypothetical protein